MPTREEIVANAYRVHPDMLKTQIGVRKLVLNRKMRDGVDCSEDKERLILLMSACFDIEMERRSRNYEEINRRTTKKST